MRLLFRFAVLRDPEPPPSVIHAAAAQPEASARWFAGSLDLKSLLAVSGLLVTLVGFRVSTQTSLAEGRAEREAEKSARIDAVEKLDSRVRQLERNTVGRAEIMSGFAHAAERQAFTEQQVQQLYTLQLRPVR